MKGHCLSSLRFRKNAIFSAISNFAYFIFIAANMNLCSVIVIARICSPKIRHF